MTSQRISTSFSKYTDANFETKAQHIFTSLTDNDNFPEPYPAVSVLGIATTNYSKKLVAAANLGRNEVAEKNAARQALEALLAQEAAYVMSIANGDVAMLTSSGFTLTKQRQPRYITNPGNVVLKNGVTSGEMIASVPAVAAASSYRHEICDTVPGPATVWTSTVTTTCKFTHKNLQPGRQYWVRIIVGASRQQEASSSIATQFAQ